MPLKRRIQIALTLTLFVLAFSGLAVHCYLQESATWDEPIHLTYGYSTLKFGDYSFEPTHPPFLRLWAALPLLFDKNITFDSTARCRRDFDTMTFSHRFMYQDNDADRMLNSARFMMLLLSLFLGIVVFSWAFELFGFRSAVMALALFTVEPNILAHSYMVHTDMGFVFCFTGTLYFLWRTCREITLPNLFGFCAFFGLAFVCKFSVPILAILTFLLLAIHATRRVPWPICITQPVRLNTRASRVITTFCILVLLAVAAYATIWAAYRFRYSPTPAADNLFTFRISPHSVAYAPNVSRMVSWIDKYHLLPNAYIQGFLSCLTWPPRPSFLVGEYSANGWWNYFLLGILVKTPVTILILFLLGLTLSLTRRSNFANKDLFLLVPLVVYLMIASSMKINAGLRHILPIYPILIILASKTATALPARPGRLLVAAACVVASLETAWVAPHYLAYFNVLAGGPRQGINFLVDSNLDWGQDLKGLKKWMDAHDVKHINLSYFGMADPSYYGISCTYLLGSPFFAEPEITNPKLPGYVAVSATNLRGQYLNEKERAYFEPLLKKQPIAMIGYSIYIYRLDRPW